MPAARKDQNANLKVRQSLETQTQRRVSPALLLPNRPKSGSTTTVLAAHRDHVSHTYCTYETYEETEEGTTDRHTMDHSFLCKQNDSRDTPLFQVCSLSYRT